MVTPARAVGVEVSSSNAVGEQVLSGGAFRMDCPGGRDVIGRNAVPEHHEAPRAGDVIDRACLRRHPVEVRRPAHICRFGIPREEGPRGDRQLSPPLISGEDVGIRAAEAVAVDTLPYKLGDLGRSWPEVAQKDIAALAILPERLRCQVNVDPPGNGVGYDERRRGEIVRLHLRMDPRLEVAIARQNRAGDETALGDRPRDRLGKRTGVTDASRAPVAHRCEP